MAKNVKDMLRAVEYIGYLKGVIINMVADDDIEQVDRWVSELRAALKEQAALTDDPPQTAHDRLAESSMRAIRDSMVRLEKK